MVSNSDYEIMHKAYAEALFKILELESQLAEARRDGARLDFAERGRLDIYHRSLMPESKQWGITTAHPHPAHRKHFAKRTLRAVIDAAMKEAK